MPVSGPTQTPPPSDGTQAATGSSSSAGSTNAAAANPTPLPNTSWGYDAYQKPLFGGSNQVRSSDVVQHGSLNADCYVLADLQILADIKGDFIKNHIKEVPNPDDAQHPNYQVTLYKDGKPENVTVDGKEMLEDDRKRNSGVGAGIGGSDQGPSTSLWPALYEKAYAISTGKSISEISGGSSLKAWNVLTGAGGTGDFTATDSPAALAKLSQKTEAEGGGLVIGTHVSIDHIGTKDEQGNRSIADGRYTVTPSADGDVAHIVDNKSPDKQAWDIPLNHAMNVKSTTSLDSEHPDPTTVTDPDKLMVNIQNPWGPSITNVANLQGVPFRVVQAVSTIPLVLDPPKI